MALVSPGDRELTEFMPHHILRDINGNEFLAIMNRERMPHHFRNDG